MNSNESDNSHVLSPNADTERVDEELYSRQLYVIGHEAMLKIMSARVLIVGLDGVGQEIAKNIALAGMKHIWLYDKEAVDERALGSGYFLRREDIGKPRDASAAQRLKRLNRYVEIRVATGDPMVSSMNYDIVASVNQGMEYNVRLNEVCHKNGVKFMLANAVGLFTQIFCDFVSHTCIDKDGESPSSGAINDITPDGIVTLVEGARHTLDTGDSVRIRDRVYKVRVEKGKTQMRLEGYEADELKMGGDFEEVKIPIRIEFRSLKEALESPVIMDFEARDSKRLREIHDLFVTGDSEESLKEKFDKMKGTLIPPICSILGGFAAQELIKAISQKFMPVQEFYYYDCSELFVGEVGDYAGRYQDMKIIFGEEGFQKLQNMKIFLVGAGAIGCENLKNFICSGIGSNGEISVTDMDSVEQSNLNRQFLFRAEDVTKMKSVAAARRAMELNEDYSGSIMTYKAAVSTESEGTFSDKFLESNDVISNALDNVEARAYMDRRCIQLRRPMFDAGTLGTKGHVQSVIPFVSESYSSSSDPQEKSIPLCTIKSYPYAIEHVIEWAMGEFKRYFNEEVLDVKEYLESKDTSLEEIFQSTPKNVEECLKTALSIFVSNFSTSIQNLLNSFPPDHIDDQGNLFWSPPKKIPTPISFNINDKLHVGFIYSAANLYAECYNIRNGKEERIEEGEVYAFLENVLSLREPNPIQFEGSEADLTGLKALEFDKDSYHVNFVHAASNLRARNYGIKEKSKHFIRGIAGRIIPAIATTTAVVSGLACIEIIKWGLRGDNKEIYRNTYLDLATPFLAQTEIVGPADMFYSKKGEKEKFNIWSRLEFGDGTLEEVVKRIEEEIGDEVSMISLGSRVIYWTLCEKYKENLNKRISELCKKKDGQSLVYLDVLPEADGDMIDVAVIFE